MASLGDIFLRLALQGTQLEVDARKQGAKAGDAAGKALGEHTSQAFSESIKRGFGFGVGIGLFNAVQNSISGVANSIEGLIATSLAKAGEVERFTTQFEVLLGSVGAADERIRELVEFAATTPFELPQVIEASRTLQVFTQGALATGEGLRMVGDIAAGTGQPIQEVSMWVGRLYDAMQSGRPFGEASQRLQELGAVSGEDRALIERLAQSVKDGTMTMTEGWDAASATFAKFSGLMEKQSRTLEGQFSNLSDATGQAFAAVGEALLPIAKEVIPQVISLVSGLGRTIAAFIKENAVPLRDMILSLTQTIVGFVSGLFTMNQALGGTTAALIGSAADAGSQVAMTFEEWRKATGNLPPAIDKTKAATKAATAAINAQIQSTNKLIDREKARDTGSETVFQRTMKRLAGEYSARLDSLDLAEREIAISERKRDLNDQLNQAQLDLAKAQRGAGGVDAEAVSGAMAKIADIQAQQAENERQATVDAQKARLQATQDYIENVAKIEADAEDKKSLANTLAKRRIKLTSSLQVATAAKDADAIADITAKLEAVKTAEERTAQARRSQDRQNDLAVLKTRLEEQKKVQTASTAATTADLKAQWAAYMANFEVDSSLHVKRLEGIFGGDPGRGTGLGGSITKSFTDGVAAGENFRKWIEDQLLPAIGKITDFLGGVVGKLNEIGANKIFKILFVDVGAALGSDNSKLTGTPEAMGEPPEPTFGTKGAKSELGNILREIWDRYIGNPLTGNTFKGRAAGGSVMRGVPFIGNEQRQEFFVPSESGTIIPSIGSLGGLGALQPIEVTVISQLDGREIARSTSRIQAEELHH